MQTNKKVKLIAFYLPQFHPVPENNEWWGPGFTEWTNVAKAKSLFPGHKQPKVPSELGHYDLRVSETREQQAELAKKAGIEGFCYWHYWFGNKKRILERPFNEVLKSGKPDFPFCLGWANHSWKKKTWIEAKKDKLLLEQIYPGDQDYIDHFYEMLPAFSDKRYLKNKGKLIFLIWDPFDIPDPSHFMSLWNSLAIENGLKGFYFIGFTYDLAKCEEIHKLGFDSVCPDSLLYSINNRKWLTKRIRNILNLIGFRIPRMIRYDYYANMYLEQIKKISTPIIPCILPNFDHTPRSGHAGNILYNSTPKKFAQLLDKTISYQITKEDTTKELIFIKSWNEWGEGNYLEPDLENGDSYLKELHKTIIKYNSL